MDHAERTEPDLEADSFSRFQQWQNGQPGEAVRLPPSFVAFGWAKELELTDTAIRRPSRVGQEGPAACLDGARMHRRDKGHRHALIS